MANTYLTNAKNAKNDEFYTQYHDIEKEINTYFDFNTNVVGRQSKIPRKYLWDQFANTAHCLKIK
jgi:hypothetical protein